jgi:MinD-like ATPase involved in chromosome partitioning or flagellar assembly
VSTLSAVVVAGVPNLAQALRASGAFPAVHDAGSTSALRALVTGAALRGIAATQLVFIVGDAIVEDDASFPLNDFLRKITTAGYNVIIVSVTPRGADLQRQHPKSQLLVLPLTVNATLYAIGTFGIAVDPVPGGTVEIPVHGQAPEATPAPAAGGWQPAQPAVAKPTAQPAPQPTPVQPAPAPVQPTPSRPEYGFGQTPAQPAAPVVNPYGPPPTGTPASGSLIGSEWTPPARTLADYAQQRDARTAPVQPAPYVPAPTPFAPAQPAPYTPAPAPFAPAEPAVQNSWQQSPDGWGQNPAAPISPATSWSPAQRAGANVAPKAQRRGYVITISVSKGGTGKSSMTLNLAAFLGMRLRAQGKTVCVIDANTQQADSGKYLDVYHPNVSSIVNDPNLLSEDRILSALVHRPEFNLSILLGPATPDEANPLSINPRLYSEVLELLKQHYDYIFIDTPVAEKFHEMFSEFALAKNDYLIVPVAPSFQTLHNADNWLRAAVVSPRHEGGAGFDRNRIGIVLNRAEEGIGCTEDDVRATMANWHYIGAIPETKEWKAANNRNELVAPKNFADLSHAFAEVLHAATSEPSLLENFSTLEQPKQGFLDRLRGRAGRR